MLIFRDISVRIEIEMLCVLNRSSSPRCCRSGRGGRRSDPAGEVAPAVTWGSMGRSPRTRRSSPSSDGRGGPCGCTAQRHRSPTSLRRTPEETGTIACWPRATAFWGGPHTRCCCRGPRPKRKIIQKSEKFSWHNKCQKKSLPNPNLMKSCQWHGALAWCAWATCVRQSAKSDRLRRRSHFPCRQRRSSAAASPRLRSPRRWMTIGFPKNQLRKSPPMPSRRRSSGCNQLWTAPYRDRFFP